MQKITDKEILELYAVEETREKGFNLLVKKFSESIYWHLRKIVVTHEDANDIMQNVFLKIWQHLGNFRNDSKLYTWIYRIATNEALTHLKSSKKKSVVQYDGECEDFFSAQIKDDNFFKGSEIEKKLHQNIQMLPEKQKIVFLLRYYQNMNYNQMSEVLNTNVNTLKATYHIAVKKIEENLKNN